MRVAMRNYFSTYLLWSAQHSFGRAKEIEQAHTGKARFDIEHRAYVLTSVMSAAGFMEAMVNELFQDAHDSPGAGSSYVAPLSARTQELMREWWALSGEGFERVLEKCQLLLVFAEKPKLDKGAQPYQDGQLLICLRNKVMHYRPEWVAVDVQHDLEKSLRGKFADNALMAGSKNPWWPDHALGARCAEWAYRSSKALADRVTSELGITPNYQAQTEWAFP